MLGTAVLATISAAALAAAGLRLRKAARAEQSGRREILADCLPLLDSAVLNPDPSGYDVLRGRYRGFEAALRPVAEQLAFRRLPQLWLIASVRLPTGAEATLDVLRRPTGAEFFALGPSLPEGFRPPASWPQDSSVRGSRGAEALLPALAGPLAPMLADDLTKEVSVTPAGARVVRRLRQGERGAYLLFRDSRFENARAEPAEAARALDLAISAALAVMESRQSKEHADDASRAA